MFEIGNSLREARLRQGLEIPRIEAETKIRGKYLRALEEEEFEVLPGDTYVKGFLRTYADYLGLDGQLYLDEYNSRFTTAEEISVTQSQSSATPRKRGRRRMESNFVVVALAGIVAVTVLVVVGLAGIGTGSDEDPPLPDTTSEGASTETSPGATTPNDAAAPAPKAKLVLTAARGDSFLQVRNGSVSGKLLWEGTLEQGQTQRFLKYHRLWVDLDDPQNLNAKLNGRQVELPTEPAVVLVTPARVRVLDRDIVARPRAVVVLTGSELVRGDKSDANGAFLARELTALGLEPARMLLVGDDPVELEAAMREGLAADLCVLSGGLGPTHDDRTVEMLARVAGRGLVVDEGLAAEIEGVSRAVAERLARPYADFAPGVRKQASLPQGGVSLGLAGTAPAVVLEHDGRMAVALPGPPNELRRLWPRVLECAALERLLARVATPSRRILRFFGPSESAVARVLEDAGGEVEGLEVTVCAQDLEIRVDLFDQGGAEEAVARLHAVLRARFADDLFAEDERTVGELVLARCRRLGLTLATAESCTGGLVSARLTDVPGSSDVFLGGIVSYSNEAKVRQLGVPVEMLERHGAVSAETAEAMADGARTALDADAAVSVTGIAGPEGGTPEKPVGLVFISAVAPDRAATERIVLSGDREAVRGRATALALHTLRRLL